MSNIAYRRDIDGLRSLAVLPVVFNHAGFSAFPGGFVGVDIFFVISGYLITSILGRELSEQRFSIVKFYERRARRILPALLVMILACLVVGWFIMLPDEFVRLSKSATAALLFSSNIWFWQAAGNYFGPDVGLEPLLHTWSLAVEEQFYIFFPLLLWLLAKGPQRLWPWVIAGLSVISLGLSIWATQADPTANFYLMPTRTWELGLGALLALGAFPRLRHGWAAQGVAALGLTTIVASIVLIDDATPFPGIAALPPCLGAVAIIWAGMDRQQAVSRFLSLAPFVWVGLISYSLYLWHWPVLIAARMLENSMVLPVLVASACLVISLVLAVLSWWFVEQPFRRPDRGFKLSRSGIFAASGAGIVAVGALATAVYLTNGIPSRIDPQVWQTYHNAVRTDELDKHCTIDDVNDHPCFLGAAGQEPIRYIIWGDSHAGAMLPGFDNWLKARDLRGASFTKAACAPMLGIRRADLNRWHNCDKQNKLVLEKILREFPNATVVLAARWALTVEGYRMDGEGGKPASLARTGENPRGIAANAALTEEGLDRMVRALRSAGHPVVIIASVPEVGYRVPKAVARAAFLELAIKVPQRSTYDRRNRRADPILRRVAKRYGASVVNVADLICNRSTCPISSNGTALYRDDDHLSVAGAIWLIPQIMAQADVATPRTGNRKPAQR